MSEIRTDTINNASGDNDSGIDLSTNDQVGIKTANTTAVTVDASQNVGIGTTSPSQKLHVAGGNPVAVVESTTSSGSFIQFENTSSTNTNRIGYAVHDFVVDTNGSERSRIDSNGNIMFGSSSQLNSGKISVLFNGASQNGLILKNTHTNGNHIEFVNSSGTAVGNINQTVSNTVSYNTSSDYRLKENVTADWDATTRLKQLNPVRFNFIVDADTTVDGFLAHEVQSVVPEAITGTHNEVEVWQDGEELPDGVSVGDNKLDDDGNTIPKYQGIDQSKLVPLLVKTIQELEARIEALENA